MDEFVFFAVIAAFILVLNTCSTPDKVDNAGVACYMHGSTGC